MDSVTILDLFCAKKRASRPIIEEKQKVLTEPEIDDFGHFAKAIYSKAKSSKVPKRKESKFYHSLFIICKKTG